MDSFFGLSCRRQGHLLLKTCHYSSVYQMVLKAIVDRWSVNLLPDSQKLPGKLIIGLKMNIQLPQVSERGDKAFEYLTNLS